jgi:hypothetical protein
VRRLTRRQRVHVCSSYCPQACHRTGRLALAECENASCDVLLAGPWFPTLRTAARRGSKIGQLDAGDCRLGTERRAARLLCLVILTRYGACALWVRRYMLRCRAGGHRRLGMRMRRASNDGASHHRNCHSDHAGSAPCNAAGLGCPGHPSPTVVALFCCLLRSRSPSVAWARAQCVAAEHARAPCAACVRVRRARGPDRTTRTVQGSTVPLLPPRAYNVYSCRRLLGEYSYVRQ